MRRFVFAAACWLALTIAPTLAPAAPQALSAPRGWETEFSDGGLNWRTISPQGTGISIVFDTAAKTNQPIKQWFDREITGLSSAGPITQRAGITTRPGLLLDTFLFKMQGVTARVFAFGWETAAGKQAVLVMMRGEVSVNDPVVQQAFGLVASAWRQKAALNSRGSLVALDPEPESRPVAANIQTARATPSRSTPPSAPATKRGGRCREEMRTINTMQLQQVCYPSMGGMSNCSLQSVPTQQQVLQTQCY